MDNLLVFDYPRGHMELVIDRFFPCIFAKARLVFPLIRHYASEDEKAKLRAYLERCIKENKEVENALADQLWSAEYEGSKKGLQMQIAHARTVRKRAQRNLEYLNIGRY